MSSSDIMAFGFALNENQKRGVKHREKLKSMVLEHKNRENQRQSIQYEEEAKTSELLCIKSKDAIKSINESTYEHSKGQINMTKSPYDNEVMSEKEFPSAIILRESLPV